MSLWNVIIDCEEVMIDLQVDLNQIAKIKTKMEKYPPYVMGKGLDAASSYLNTPTVKASLYPPSQSGSPFVWSSERQRRFVFANIKLPSQRTMNLANSGEFKVEKKFSSLYIYYQNTASYAKWVIGNFTTIIGHRMRGWLGVNTTVVNRRSDVVNAFDKGINGAWKNMP